jgi:DNA-directed RNA polymerase subunit M/transcription elongation factor TFIIS
MFSYYFIQTEQKGISGTLSTLSDSRVSLKSLQDMQHLDAICPKCGTHYQGWVIERLGKGVCLYCGVNLKIKNSSVKTLTHSSSVTAEKMKIIATSEALSAEKASNRPQICQPAELPAPEIKENKGLEWSCPDCGARYQGWAFITPRNRFCIKCGSVLRVKQDGAPIISGFSPYKLKEYKFNSGQHGEWENLCTRNLVLYMNMN